VYAYPNTTAAAKTSARFLSVAFDIAFMIPFVLIWWFPAANRRNAPVRVRILRAKSRLPASSRDDIGCLRHVLSEKVTASVSSALNRAETVPADMAGLRPPELAVAAADYASGVVSGCALRDSFHLIYCRAPD
jgi:hypothetical protein